MNNIDFTDYERISDVLMYLSDRITLNFTVQLAKKSLSGERMFFSFETKYTPDKYNYNSVNNGSVRSIKRNMNFYFTIDIKDSFGAGIILRPQDAEMLLMTIEQKVFPWYFGSAKEVAFQIVDKRLTLKKYTQVQYVSNGKFITLDPIVYSYENGDFNYGIRLGVGNVESVDLELERFMGFVRLLRTDMYATACAMINYTKIPPYGINAYEMKGLGAGRAPREQDWNSNNTMNNNKNKSNSFLDNSKSKKE